MAQLIRLMADRQLMTHGPNTSSSRWSVDWSVRKSVDNRLDQEPTCSEEVWIGRLSCQVQAISVFQQVNHDPGADDNCVAGIIMVFLLAVYEPQPMKMTRGLGLPGLPGRAQC